MFFRHLPVVWPSATLALALGVAAATGGGPLLTPGAIVGWNAYVAATEQRISRELTVPARFLVQDFGPGADANRRALMAGQTVINEMVSVDARGSELAVPDAMVHHWRGAVFLPGLRLDDLMQRLRSGTPGAKPEDVLVSRVLERGPDRVRVYLRLQRRKFVTVVYNTEHTVTFQRHSPTRASSASTATRIAEVESAGSPAERELPVGQDRGFLWRLNSYWRYEQVSGGVIAECESVSLSRAIPYGLGYVVAPLVASTARESMARTLSSLQTPRAWSPVR